MNMRTHARERIALTKNQDKDGRKQHSKHA